MKLATIGVGLGADLGPAHAASVVVLVAVRQDQEEVLSHGVGLLAARAEQARRLKLAEAVYHVSILDHNSVGWAARARQPGGYIFARRESTQATTPQTREEVRHNSLNVGISRPRWPTPARSATIAAPCSPVAKRPGSATSSPITGRGPSKPIAWSIWLPL